MSHYDSPSLPDRVHDGNLRFLFNIGKETSDDEFSETDEERIMSLARAVGETSLVLGPSMAPNGTFGTVPGTGVYVLESAYEQINTK